MVRPGSDTAPTFGELAVRNGLLSREQFEELGFKANDIVTAVNGIELTDPGKAIKLYEVMRSADEASFEVLRNGESVMVVPPTRCPS